MILIILLIIVYGLTKNTLFRLPLYADENSEFGIGRLNQIIQSCPHNLNGYIAAFELCIPASRVLSGDITEDDLKLNLSDISDTNKLGPTDFGFDVLSKNIESGCLNFNNFYGGTIIIYGNNYFFRKDEEFNTEFNFSETKEIVETNNILKYIQSNLVTTQIPEQDEKLITLSGLSINGNYSILSFRNINCDSYIYNLKLENTIKNGETYYLRKYHFPELNDVIGYWPLIDNFSPQLLNTNYLTTSSFIFNSQEISSTVITGSVITGYNQYVSGMIMNNSYNTLPRLYVVRSIRF